MVRHEVSRRGAKGLPALLCLAVCRSVGGDRTRGLPAAAALDLAGGFVQLHASLWSRRFPATRQWGEGQLINAGDALFSLARLSLLDLRKGGATPEQIAGAISALDGACLKALESGDTTGALLPRAFEMGAMLGGASDSLCSELGKIGESLAFSIQDRAATGDLTGHAEASNILEKVEALHLVHADELKELIALALGGRYRRKR